MSATSALAESIGGSVNRLSLLHDHNTKTVDVGCNGHTVSCGAVGDILQLTCYHPIHGIVVACPFAQFDGARFHDPEYVREYRKKLLDYVRSGTRGFGLQLEGQIRSLNIEFVNDRWISFTYVIGHVRISTTVSVNKNNEVEQSMILTSNSSKILDIGYGLDLRISVNRASYGQLTEGGPIPIPPSENDFRLLDSKTWAIINQNLDAMIEGSLYINQQPVDLDCRLSEAIFQGRPANKTHLGNLQLHPQKEITIMCTLKLHSGILPSRSPQYSNAIYSRLSDGWKLPVDEQGIIIRRNLEYILGVCALPLGEGIVCFITDHVALPLGWNRDNYWQIRFLLDVYQNLVAIAHPKTAQGYASRIHDSIKGHLKWVFQVAQRPHEYWHRSYLVTGVPKDGPVFQLDQQCYPLLELCDFFEQFPNERHFVESIVTSQTLRNILQMLEDRRDEATGLFYTEETPGDDEVEHPFHFSSHILLWRTYTQLALLLKRIEGPTSPLSSGIDSRAAHIKQITLKHFIGKHPTSGQTLFAYLTDGAGHQTFYHDANDIPTLFALDWDFINTPALQAIWKQTMSFGLSPLNDGGYYPEGEFGGLGSVHTKGPWPLGYAQEFVFAHLIENDAGKADAWRRIKGSVFWDGLFPEAVDCHTGDCVSKAWFSWPGSMIGSALVRFGLKGSLRAVI